MTDPAANPPIRLIGRKMGQALFDSAMDWKRVFGGNINHTSVGLAVWLANTEYSLKDPALLRGSRHDGLTFDQLKPIIAPHVATASDFDDETARRYLTHLIETGLLSRSGEGYALSPAFMGSPDYGQLIDLSTRRVLDLFRYLNQFEAVRVHLRSLNSEYDITVIDNLNLRLTENRYIVHLHFMRLISKFSIERYFVLDDSKLLAMIGFGLFVENVRVCTADPVMALQYGAYEPPLPASLKTPVSMRRLAIALDTPQETIRRNVLQLEQSGFIVNTGKGYLVPGENLMLYETMVSQAAAIARFGADVTQALADFDSAS